MRFLHDTKLLSCELTENQPTSAPVLLLVGDSHADSVKSAFKTVSQELGYRLFFMSSNYVLIPSPSRDQVLALAKDIKADGIIIHYASGKNAKAVYESGFAEQARKQGIPSAWLLPVPTYNDRVPKMIWENFSSGANFHPSPVNIVEVENLRRALTTDGVKLFDSYPAFCAEECDVMDVAMHPFYFDSGHLTLTGAERLRPVIEQMMDWLISSHKKKAQSKEHGHAVQQGAQPDGSAAG